MIDRWSFRQKIGAIVLSGVGAVVLFSVLSVMDARRALTEARRAELVTAVQSVHNIVAGFKDKADKGQMAVDEAKKAATEAVQLSRYGGASGKTDYSYIWSMDGVGVMHGGDAGCSERGGGAGTFKEGGEVRIVIARGRAEHELDGDVAAEEFVASEPHDAHAAAADLADELDRSESLGHLDLHGRSGSDGDAPASAGVGERDGRLVGGVHARGTAVPTGRNAQ